MRYVKLVALALLLLFLGALALGWISVDLRALAEWTHRQGIWAPVWLALAYVVASILMIPASILTLAGAYLLGFVPAFFAVWVGSVAGATAAFLIARTILRAPVARFFSRHPRFAALDAAVRQHGLRIVILTRLAPLLPYNLLNYAFGVTQVRLRDYVMGSWLGMVPGILAFCYAGSALRKLGDAEAGLASQPALQQALFYVGLPVTLVVMLYLTQLAKRSLTSAMDGAGEGAEAG